MAQLPQPPEPVDHHVVGEEDRVVGSEGDLGHGAARPDMHVIVVGLQLLLEVQEVAPAQQLADLRGRRQAGRVAGIAGGAGGRTCTALLPGQRADRPPASGFGCPPASAAV